MTPSNPLVDYFRCPDDYARVEAAQELSTRSGYFTLGEAICYGRLAGRSPSTTAADDLPDASKTATVTSASVRLPFDLAEVVRNLREERYHYNGFNFLNRVTATGAAQNAYYLVRPLLGVSLRKHLQKIRLSGWQSIDFPRWPVDVSVDSLMRETLGWLIRQHGGRPVPFVWFWPDEAQWAAVVTHDVEGAVGRTFCDRLMDVDESYGVKAAFQLIPEGQETAWRATAERLRRRGFEVNLHDLNHDGHLFRDRTEFLRRAQKINSYAREFGCSGFRSGAMYRQQSWYDAFEFAYDMSVPNVAHLEPQRGGCCTVMPYFIGRILELPLTTIQDYSLFHILGDYSTTLWQQQIDVISQQNGLVTLLSHPDYLAAPAALAVYEALLSHLRQLRAEKKVWMALPADVNRWWRNRHQMRLTPDGDTWRIDGPDAERARVAYATLHDGRVQYTLAA